MAERKHTHGLELTVRNGVMVVSIGDMEIWDGADLSLIRDTLFALISKDGCSSIGVDMRYVQYVPSGFFGMLFDWFERGVQVRLYHPRERVRNMLWFRMFFDMPGNGVCVLHDGKKINEEVSEDLWINSPPGSSDKMLVTIAG